MFKERFFMNMKYVLPITFALSFVAAKAAESVVTNNASVSMVAPVVASKPAAATICFLNTDKIEETKTHWLAVLDGNVQSFNTLLAIAIVKVAKDCGFAIVLNLSPKEGICLDSSYDITQKVIEQIDNVFMIFAKEAHAQKETEAK